jgi:hypothetical protein
VLSLFVTIQKDTIPNENENNLIMKSSFILITILLNLFLTSCVSEEQKKKEVVVQITNHLCENISELLSANATNTDNSNQEIIVALVKLLHIPTEKCCTCVMVNIEEELLSKFTYDELQDIQQDNVKQLMVAKKIIENNPTQEKIAKCIKDKMLGKYEEFNNELEDKFKESTKNE